MYYFINSFILNKHIKQKTCNIDYIIKYVENINDNL